MPLTAQEERLARQFNDALYDSKDPEYIEQIADRYMGMMAKYVEEPTAMNAQQEMLRILFKRIARGNARMEQAKKIIEDSIREFNIMSRLAG